MRITTYCALTSVTCLTSDLTVGVTQCKRSCPKQPHQWKVNDDSTGATINRDENLQILYIVLIYRTWYGVHIGNHDIKEGRRNLPTKFLRLDARSTNIPPSRSKSDSREGSRCETFSLVRLSYQTRGLKKLQVDSRLRYWRPEGDVLRVQTVGVATSRC